MRWIGAQAALAALLMLLLFTVPNPHAAAQQEAPDSVADESELLVDPAAEAAEAETDSSTAIQPDKPGHSSAPSRSGGMMLFYLLSQAGWFFMVPIWVASIFVVAVIIERFFALRRAKVLPDGLVRGLGELGKQKGVFDPREAYRLCHRYPSVAATVVRAMLLKVGRPHSEVEHTVREVCDREANRLYARVRWLNLAAAVAPLWGLLGTVWGMMMAFYDTTQLAPGQNKAEALAEGIYTALVTTLCGLFIAIPSAIFAHLFEGRIFELFHQIDEFLFNLLPQVERFEGRVRFSRHTGEPIEEGSVDGSVVLKERTAPSAPK